MKRTFTFALIAALASFVANAQAASLQVDTRTVGGSTVYSIFLNELTLADEATALSVSLLPGSGQFENFNATGFEGTTQLDATADFSFTNASLSLPSTPPFFGQGWGIIDGSPEVAPPSSPSGIGYAASNPGNFLAADNLLLNNVMLPTDTTGSALVVLLGGDGNPLDGGRLEAALGGVVVDNPVARLLTPGNATLDYSLGQPSTQTVTFDNSGDGDLMVTGVSITGDPNNRFLVPTLGDFTENPADNFSVDVSLDLNNLPNVTESLSAVLNIETNGGNLMVDLTGVVPEPTTMMLAGLAMIGLVVSRRS